MASLRLPLLAGAFLLGMTGIASAQDMNQYGDLDITLRVPDDDFPEGYRDMNEDEQERFFNLAHCQCESPLGVELRLTMEPASLPDAVVQLWAGTGCTDEDDDPDAIRERCNDLGSDVKLRDVDDGRTEIVEVTANEIMFPGGECNLTSSPTSPNIFAFVDPESDFRDLDSWQLEEGLPVDVQPPPEHEDLTASAGEETITLDWEPPEGELEIDGYYVLCAVERNGQWVPMLDEPTVDDPVYESAGTECPGKPTRARARATRQTVTGADAALADAPAAYICGVANAGVSTVSVDVPDGEAGPIAVRLLVYDEHRNPRVMTPDPAEVSTGPVVDFWEHYQQSGGKAEGGYCAVSPGARGGRGLGLLVGLLVLAIVPIVALVWRRRAARAAVVALVVGLGAMGVGPGEAEAQLILEEEPEGPPTSDWTFEFKLGPYLPDIDGTPDLMGQPFDEMFGNDSIVGVIELDRYFLWPAGALGVAFQAGWFRETGRSFLPAEDGTTTMERHPSETTQIRIIPTSVSAVYRFNLIADYTKVPVVPYGKVGVSYYLWRIAKGNGDASSTPEAGTAHGGSWGWQGTVGLAFRLDGLDPGASDNMRADWGVEHTNLFGELLYADVDGFGDETQLRVGDFTWLAGLGFDF